MDKEGVKIIIALGHSGYKKDLEIAEMCCHVDVVIGGHSNTFLYTKPKEETKKQPDIELPENVYPTMVTNNCSGKQVPVAQAYAFTKYLGRLDLSVSIMCQFIHIQNTSPLHFSNKKLY